ncbi:MAG: right-handed parallel beta-helix repeat-containing protein [Candidatus Heimdallarchaeota archaeon]
MSKKAYCFVLLFILSVLLHAQPSVSVITESSEGKESQQVLESTGFQNVDENGVGLDASSANSPADVNSEEVESLPQEKMPSQAKMSSRTNLPSPTASYTPSNAIEIYGDADFNAQASDPSKNWDLGGSRTGALGLPYLISGLNITNSTHTPINITLTSVYFEIRDCYIDAVANGLQGIYLKNVQNGVVANNTINNTSEGVSLWLSNWNTIANNSILDMTGQGVKFWLSQYNTIFNNTIDFGSMGSASSLGLYLWGSPTPSSYNNVTNNAISNANRGGWVSSGSNNRFTNNTITNCSKGFDLETGGANNLLINNTIMNNTIYDLYIAGSSNNITGNQFGSQGLEISGSPRQKEVSSNYVNGRLLVYLNDTVGGTYTTPNSLGQVVLVNCSFIEIGLQNLSLTRYGIWAVDSSDLLIHNNTMANNSQGGFAFANSANSTISDNLIANTSRGIKLPGSAYNMTIENNTILHSSSYGIEVYQSNNNTIIENQIHFSTSAGIYSYQAQDNYIAGNTITNGSTAGFTNAGIYIFGTTPQDNNTIAHNTLENNRQGIRLFYAFNTTLLNNTATNNYESGIYVELSDNNTLIDNWAINNGATGIYLKDSDFLRLRNNTASNNNHGFYMGTVIDSIFKDNTAIGNNYYGLGFQSSSHNVTLEMNTFSNNSEEGVVIDGSNNLTLQSNTIHNNGEYGVWIKGNSYTLFILNNTFFGNVFEGILSESTSGAANTVKWNDFAANNLMYSPQARDSAAYTIFDGNFWDDWVSGSYDVSGGVSNYDYAPVATPNDPLFHYLSTVAPGLTLPGAVKVFGNITIDWNSVTDYPFLHSVTVSLYYNVTGAIDTWIPLATDLPSGNLAYEWNTTTVPNGNYRIRLVARDTFGVWLAITMPTAFEIENPHTLPAPTVTAPDGGQILQGNTTITWTNIVDSFASHQVNYSIYYSADNSTWVLLVDSLPQGTVSWVWNTSLVAEGDGTTYLIKVVASDEYGIKSEDISDDYFTLANAHILGNPIVGSPNGDEVLTAGNWLVSWVAAPDSHPHNIDYQFYYSSDGGATWTLSGGTHTQTSFTWYFGDYPNGANYRVKIEATCDHGLTSSDTSDASFTIQNPGGGSHTLDPPMVNSPNGAEVLSGVITISWTAAYDSEGHYIAYNIYYSPDSGNGDTWNQIAWGEAGTSFDWDTTTVGDGSSYVIKVEADDGYGNFAHDISDNPFTIDNSGGGMSSEPSSEAPPDDSEPSATTPGLTMVLTLFSLIAILGVRKLKKGK